MIVADDVLQIIDYKYGLLSQLLMKGETVPRNGGGLKAMVRSSWRILCRLFLGISFVML